MAENVQITPGSGVTIGADNVLDGTLGNAQIQYVKIMDGTISGTNKAAVTANGLAVDGSGVTQPISAASLPLPTGAATESTLSAIKTDTDNLDVALSTRASEATLTSIDSQISQLTFISTRLVVDGSGVIQPVSGTVAVSNFPATQPISGTVTANAGTGTFLVDGSAHTQPVSGTVTVGNASLAVTQSGVWSVGRTWTLASGTDSISAVQSGTWNINNISGTISLPTGASTSALQTSGNASLSSIDGKTPPLGQTTMSASSPVVIASDQSTIPVSLTSTTITGTVAVTQSTSPWVVSGTVTANIGTSGSLALDATVAALEVTQGSTTSGQKGILELGAVTTAAPTYTTGQTSPLSLDTAGNLRVVLSSGSIDIGKVDQGLQGTIAQSWFTEITDGTNVLGTSTHPIRIDPTGTTTQPVNVTNASIAVTQSTSPWVVSGTVTANAGTGNFTVVQSTGTNLHTVIDSGSITVANATLAVTQSGVWSTGRTWTLASGTDSVAAVQSGTWNINNISGTISLPTGAATETTLAAIKTDTDKFTFTSTRLLVDGSGVTQPVSGTVTANAGTGTFNIQANASTNLNQVAGSAVSTAATGIQKVGISDSAGASITNGQKTMANSVPVVVASDQSAIPVNVAGGSVSSATVTSNSVGTSAVTLLSSRAARIKAVIFNESGTLFVKAGSTASSSDYTWRLTANTELDIDSYTGIVTAIKATGTTNVQVTDF